MSAPPIQYSGPKIDAEVPESVRLHLQLIYQKLGNHTQAMSLLAANLKSASAASSSSSSISAATSAADVAAATQAATAAIVQNYPTVSQNLGQVNNKTGVTSYATLQGDNGAFLLLNASSAVAVNLTTQSPPWWTFLTNQGTGAVTVTPAIGTINGAATLSLATDESALAWFDGANWWAITTASSGSGVTSLNSQTGAVSLVAGANITITPGSPSAGDITIASSSGSGLPTNDPTFTGTMTGPHYAANGSGTTAAAGAAAGSGGSASLASGSNDARGKIQIATGTGTTTGTLATITFGTAYASTPFVIISPADGAAIQSGSVVTQVSAVASPTGITFTAGPTAPQVNTSTMDWNYWVIG